MLSSATSPPVSPESYRSKAKPNITKSNLKEHGIEYDPAILDCSAADGAANGSLPQGTIGVGELLSDLTRELIHQDFEGLLKDDLTEAMERQDFSEIVNRDSWSLLPPKSALWNRAWLNDDDNAFRSAILGQIDKCTEIAEEAFRLRDATEAAWTYYLRCHLFRNFEGTRQTRKTVDYFLEHWCLEENVRWTNHARTAKPQGERLTAPQPDLTYGFSIYKSLRDLPKGYAQLELFRNFSADTIRKLNGSPWELKASLTTKIHQEDLNIAQSPDTICFPWAVVEVKRCPDGQDVRDRCYQQAANASATALDIMTRLFEQPDGHVPDDVPPIIAYTCVGPEFRLWLMFWETKDNRRVRKMACIWATHLELAWGVFAAKRVVAEMTKWAIRVLKPSICYRLTSITIRSPLPRESGSAAPLRKASSSPSPSIGIHKQSCDPHPIAPKTPLPNDMSTRALSSDRPNANVASARTPLSGHDRPSAVQDIPAHLFSSNVQHKNRANEKAAPARKLHFPISWEAIVPIHTPFSKAPTPEKTRKTTKVVQAHDVVSSVAKASSWEKLQSDASAPMRSALEEAGQVSPTPPSPNAPGITRTTMQSGGFFEVDQRISPRSANEPSSHEKGPGAVSSPQGLNVSEAPTHVNSNLDGDITSSTMTRSSERQKSPQEEKQDSSPKSGSVEWSAGRRPDLLESRGLRYHDYRIRREIMWSWTPVMYGRLGARAEDADGSMCSNDTSDSEYVPSELDDTEREDEYEATSDTAQEEVWASQSEDGSYENRQYESGSQSEYGISEYQDDGERNDSVSDSSEYWETEDEDDEVQNNSKYGSSELWDDEVDRYTVAGSSKGGQSAYEDHTDLGAEEPAGTDDEDDCNPADNGRCPQRHHTQHETLLSGVDLERLKNMALSTLRGKDFAELPVLKSVIQTSERSLKIWNVAFWCHLSFDPTPSETRNTLVRDLNRYSALNRGDHNDTPQADTIDFAFEELRCSPLNEKLICWFTGENSDGEVQRRICMNLLRLTEAPYCATVLSYLGLKDDVELWSRLGGEALECVCHQRWA